MQSGGGAGSEKHEMVIKHALLAPIWTRIWTRIGQSSIVCCGESEYDVPGAKFYAKTTKTCKNVFGI